MGEETIKQTRTGTPQEDERPGLPFLFGFYGIEPTAESIHILRETGACGIVLLRRNVVDTQQVTDLVRNLESAVGRRLLVAIDHETGLVTRFSGQVASFPGNMALGKTGSAALAYEMGQCMARELRAMSVNVNLAPVLDVVGVAFNPGITIRSFGTIAKTAVDLGAAVIRGLQDHGVLAVAKHFPGAGPATMDTHLSMPTIGLSAAEIDSGHVAPFRNAVAAGVAMVMTGHAAYPALDDAPSSPATFSSKIVKDLLRDSLGFRGAIMTDDLCMGAIAERCPAPEAAVRAAAAGHDILLVAHDLDSQRDAFQAYVSAVKNQQIPAANVTQSRARILDLIRKATSAAGPGAPDPNQSSQLADKIAWQAVRVLRDHHHLVPVPAGKRVGIIVPRLTEVATRFLIEDDVRQTGGFVQAWLTQQGENADVLEVPVDVPAGETHDILEWAREFEVVVDFCFDATRIPGQKRLVSALESHPGLIVVFLFHPWDDAHAPRNASVVHTYGFRRSQIAAALDMVFHGR